MLYNGNEHNDYLDSNSYAGASSPGFDNFGFDAERLPPFQDAQVKPVLNSVNFTTDKLTSFKLLSKDEERNLALKLANASHAIALLTMAWVPSARDLLSLIGGATTSALKKRTLSSEVLYFELRKEMDDLANASDNSNALPPLIEAATSYIGCHREIPAKLIEYILSVDWPGPLMVALAKRYGKDNSPKSILELAIDEYLSKVNTEFETLGQPSDEHSAQLGYYAKIYSSTREKLVNHNLKLVINIAKRYAQQPSYLPDLIQEGACGLIRAAEKFRPATGNRFSTYAYRWIESTVRKARVNIDKVVPISYGCNNDLLRLSQWAKYRKMENSNPKPSLNKLPKKLDMSKQRLEAVMQLNQCSLSLDQKLTDDENLSLHTKLADPNSDFTDGVFNEHDAQYLTNIIEQTLSEREAYIINERFGRLNSDPKTLQQVSDRNSFVRQG